MPHEEDWIAFIGELFVSEGFKETPPTLILRSLNRIFLLVVDAIAFYIFCPFSRVPFSILLVFKETISRRGSRRIAALSIRRVQDSEEGGSCHGQGEEPCASHAFNLGQLSPLKINFVEAESKQGSKGRQAGPIKAMGTLLLGVATPSSSSILCSSNIISESSCCSSSFNVNSNTYAVLRRTKRGTCCEKQLGWSRCSRSSARRTTRQAEARLSSQFAAESRIEDDNSPHSFLPQNEKTGSCNEISSIRVASLATATAFLANAVCGNAWAAMEASTTGSDENSNFMFVVICIGEAIALTGAAVGGVLARQRKVELEKINTQLRQINVNLRRQSRVETYAPNLTYAPVGSGRMADLQVRSDPVRDELMRALKTGKRWLREQKPASAYGEFQSALALAQQLEDTAEQKKATRGLGAACHRQGRYKEAIKHHLLVLDISKRTGETSGDTEAYGAIADGYTELGDLETAGKYYDRYIERLETDDTL